MTAPYLEIVPGQPHNLEAVAGRPFEMQFKDVGTEAIFNLEWRGPICKEIARAVQQTTFLVEKLENFVVRLSLTAEQTVELKRSPYTYRVVCYDIAGNEYKVVLHGELTVVSNPFCSSQDLTNDSYLPLYALSDLGVYLPLGASE